MLNMPSAGEPVSEIVRHTCTPRITSLLLKEYRSHSLQTANVCLLRSPLASGWPLDQVRSKTTCWQYVRERQYLQQTLASVLVDESQGRCTTLYQTFPASVRRWRESVAAVQHFIDDFG